MENKSTNLHRYRAQRKRGEVNTRNMSKKMVINEHCLNLTINIHAQQNNDHGGMYVVLVCLRASFSELRVPGGAGVARVYIP